MHELEQIAAGYDRWASVYDHDANPLQALEEPHMRDAIGNPAGLTALDLGCGTGRHAIWLSAAGANVTAIDFSRGMLEEARKKPGAQGIRFMQHDAQGGLPFADGSFDLVVSGLVLEHIERLSPFFAEIHRVLRKGGRAVVSAMHPAMFLRGSQARFTDPVTGVVVAPGSVNHTVCDMILAAGKSKLQLVDAREVAPDDVLAEQFPRAAKYVGWPMLVVLKLEAP